MGSPMRFCNRLLLLTAFFFCSSLHAQEHPNSYKNRYHPMLLLDFGVQSFRVRNYSPQHLSQLKKATHVGFSVNLYFFQPAVHVNNVSFGPFVGAGYALPLYSLLENSHSDDSKNWWGLYRFPFGFAYKFDMSNRHSRNSGVWDGWILSAGLTYNGYDFSPDKIPGLKPIKPRAFLSLGIHFDDLGVNLYATQAQTNINRDGTATWTSMELGMSFLIDFF